MLRWKFWEKLDGPPPDYARWILRRFEQRRPEFQALPQAGLFSIVTVVQEPKAAAFDELAWSLQSQDYSHFEWVIVEIAAAGSVQAKLKEVAKDPRVLLLRGDLGRGPTAAWRLGLDAARGRYLLPVEQEDRLYPDALRVVAAFLQQHGYPVLVYTDEDQLLPSGTPTAPFCKPDWDPLLLYSGGYTARLAVLDREWAVRTGAFTDDAVGPHGVWDACCRLVAQGVVPEHLPEILYSRRVETQGLALPASVGQVQAAYHVVRHHLRRQRLAERLSIRANPLLGAPGLWRLAWQKTEQDAPIQKLVPGHTPSELLWKLTRLTDDSLVALHAPGLQPLTEDWADEARALFAALPDAVAAGGCVLDDDDRVLSSTEFLGIDGLVGSPCRGREPADTQGHARFLCQQTVGAPSADWLVVEVGFLKDLLECHGSRVSLPLLHAWIGAQARQQGFRVVYSPHLLARLHGGGADLRASAEETYDFLAQHWQDLLDDPSWSRFLSLDSRVGPRLALPAERAEMLNRSLCHLAGAMNFDEQVRVRDLVYPSRMQRPLARQHRVRRAA